MIMIISMSIEMMMMVGGGGWVFLVKIVIVKRGGPNVKIRKKIKVVTKLRKAE
jgi:hypothetical protein